MRPLRWAGIAVAILLLGVGGFAFWVLDSESGTQWAVHTATQWMKGKLAIAEVQGKLATPLQVSGVRYQDPEHGVDVSVASASLDIAFRELIAWRAHILDVRVEGVALMLSKPTKPAENKKPFTLQPPIDLIVDRFTLSSAKIEKDGQPLLEIGKALLVAGWTSHGLGIKQLAVVSPQGRVDLNAEVAQRKTYDGRATGHFRWKQGQYEYAGDLKLASERGATKADVDLSAPLAARLTAAVRQETSVPWSFNVQVPTFDPRKKWLPKSSIESLTLALQGQGDRAHAHVSGEVELNGAKVFIDPIQVALQGEVLRIEQLALRDAQHQGVLNVAGQLRFDQKPFYADLAARWHDVEIPQKVAGQKLATHGDIVARGTSSQFDTRGHLSIGPPGRLADIALAANGTPGAIALEQFDILQKQGRLRASGRVGLKPDISWRIAAQATQFDTGALFADWPGSLGFKLESEGELRAGGPAVSLKLDALAGTLRRRPIAGDADLKIAPDKTVAGVLNLKSGRSSVQVTGAGGQTLDLAASFEVASMEDWLPQARGAANGRITMKGEWPKVTVEGHFKAQGLAYHDMSVRSAEVDWKVDEPLHPHGSMNASIKEAAAAGFDLATVDFDAEGSEAVHSAHLKVNGKPFSTELRVQGRRLDKGWQGAVQTLTLTMPDIEPLALRQPAQITIAGQTFEMSDSCLANVQLSVCASAQRSDAGELQAHYIIEHLPLPLIVALAQPDAGYVVQGTLEGKGDIRRTAAGALFGHVALTSASGSVAEAGDENEPLLKYQNFELAADLNGETAHGTTRMAFNDGGHMQGELTVTDLSSAAPTLNGHGSLSIEDLSPIGLFIAQLANIKGGAQGEATVTGTFAQPNISGSARAHDLAAELPLLGLQLKDGRVEIGASGAGAVSIKGQVTSGKGQLAFEGGGDSIDALSIKASGKDVLAANIPAANVVVAPDLDFTRRDKRMDLTGTVTVSSASIDLTKLPKGSKVKQASPDIVVVDDPAPEAKAAQSMQLHTRVTVILGEGLQATELEKVKLQGFGLDAKLAGQLVVTESPGSDPLGNGEIRLEGQYKAYGQDLTIQTGRLLYANTPLNDPQIDIAAVREISDVTAKLTVKGSAQSPMLEVSSDPPLPQTAALSYLVTGKPLDQLGSGEGDVVQSAARSLGGAVGNLLSKNLGKRLGIDTIGIDNSTEIGGSAFTVGQYLSPRLYSSYGVGLFEPGQVVTLRYKISRAINVEASQGPKSQRAGINYKIEK